MKKITILVACMLLLITFSTPLAFAKEAYSNYTYNYDGNPKKEPQAFIARTALNGFDLGIGELKAPKDIYITNSGKKVVADTGNNRIIILDKDNKVERIITQFLDNQKTENFNQPSGVFVTPNGDIYIADTENARIVVLSENGSMKKILAKPLTTLLTDQFKYKPVKVIVDSANRIFVVSQNVTDGIVELNENGEFQTFYGAIKVTPDLTNLFWKSIATKAQKARMELAIPTEYTSIDIDDEDFVFGTVNSAGVVDFDKKNLIRHLNPIGNDILIRQSLFDPIGDILFYTDFKNSKKYDSKFVDVAALGNGIYSVLDAQMGRIFTYDNNGNLLYIFGGLGDKLGLFGTPEALDTYNGDYYVVDSKYNQIVIFTPAEYAKIVNEAVILQSQRQYDKAEEKWAEVLNYTSMSELAYVGKGKALYRNGQFKEAMKYFELGNDRIWHGKAFDEYRNQLINNSFGAMMTVLLLLVIALVIFLSYKKRRKSK